MVDDVLSEASSPDREGVSGLSTRIVEMDPRELLLLERNARYMKFETFQALVRNVRRDGVLTQLPLAALDEHGRYEVLSGNHRTKAAIEAGLATIKVIVTDDLVGETERRLSLQLSHNAIAGEDDPTILAELYDSLQDPEERLAAGLDDKTLALLEAVETQSLSEANLAFQAINVVFLPEEAQHAREVLDEALDQVGGDGVWLARWGEWDRVISAVAKAQSSHKVGNLATALMIVLDLAERHFDELQAGYLDANGEAKHDNFVPVETLGIGYLPASAAAVVKRALDLAVKRGDASADHLWQALEAWSADYLAGPGVT